MRVRGRRFWLVSICQTAVAEPTVQWAPTTNHVFTAQRFSLKGGLRNKFLPFEEAIEYSRGVWFPRWKRFDRNSFSFDYQLHFSCWMDCEREVKCSVKSLAFSRVYSTQEVWFFVFLYDQIRRRDDILASLLACRQTDKQTGFISAQLKLRLSSLCGRAK